MESEKETPEVLIKALRARIVELERAEIERKRQETVLRRSQEKYYDLVEHANSVILRMDNGGHIRFLNQYALKFLGYAEAELLGRNIIGTIVPERESTGRDLEAMIDGIGRAPGRYVSHICENVKKNGERVWMAWTHKPVCDDAGQVAEIICVGNDITELRQSEEVLQELEQRLAVIIDFLPDATFAIDLDGRVIAWNKAVEELTGVPARDMLGKGMYEYAVPFYGVRRPIMIDLVLKADRAIEQTYNSIVVKHKDTLIVENWVPHLKGKRACIWGKASPLYDSMGRIAGAIESVRDITDRKETEDAIRAREMELKVKTRELEDLNTALRVLLKQRENDQKDLENKIVSNIKVLVLPHLDKLKEKLSGKNEQTHLDILDANLKEIISPFVQKLSAKYINLTNREIEIANLIKEEKTTKEIAEFLHISESAVNIHRYRIRQKLHLTKKHNLKAYFSSLI